MPVCRATAITADGSCLLCRYLGTGQDVTGATVHKYAFLKTETTPDTAEKTHGVKETINPMLEPDVQKSEL